MIIRLHRIRYRDTLERLSEQYYGTREFAMVIYRHNSHYLDNPNYLTVGQEIVIPHLPIGAMRLG